MGTAPIALRILVGAVVFAAGVRLGGVPLAATQPSTPVAREAATSSRPLQIRAGSCDALGDVVVPLTNLSRPSGDEVGQAGGLTAETSLTNVPLTLDQVLAADHAISAAQSIDDNDEPVACGNVGGVVDTNRALVIGLLPRDGSGFAGVAYLTPGVDGGTIDVSVFLIEAGGVELGDRREGADPAATPGGGAG